MKSPCRPFGERVLECFNELRMHEGDDTYMPVNWM